MPLHGAPELGPCFCPFRPCTVPSLTSAQGAAPWVRKVVGPKGCPQYHVVPDAEVSALSQDARFAHRLARPLPETRVPTGGGPMPHCSGGVSPSWTSCSQKWRRKGLSRDGVA